MDCLVIVGASVRAAAFSALRAGLEPVGVDLFADADLQACCAVRRVTDYPNELERAIHDFPPSPWMYTGALENHPHLVDRMARDRPLLGNRGRILRPVRDPGRLSGALRGLPCQFPDWQRSPDGLPSDGSWLWKAHRSAGGKQVHVWNEESHEILQRGDSSAGRRRFYCQRRVEGRSAAAVYIAARGRASLLGVTQQLVGARWTGAAGFAYAGSLGPLRLPAVRVDVLRTLGDRLAEEFSLTGLFGVDLVLAPHTTYVIEVNPRFPASVEVLERALGFSAVRWHVDACRDGRLPAQVPPGGAGRCGKAVLYARRSTVMSAAMTAAVLEEAGSWQRPCIADIPTAGSHIAAGWPVMTLLADGPSLSAVREQLRRAAARWQALLDV